MPPYSFSSEYPFQSHRVSIDHHQMHYIDEGQGDTVLMFHGNPTWSFYYRNLIKALRGNYRCLAPDHIGCGLSDKPQKYPYTLETHILNMKAFLQSCSVNKFHIIAHDWGGAIAMGLAISAPEMVNKIVILNSAAYIDTHIPLRIAICKVPFFGRMAIRRFNLFLKAARSMATTKHGGLTGAVREGYFHPYNSYKNRIAIDRFVKDIPMDATHPSYPLLKTIESKLSLLADKNILLAWGIKDFCFTTHFLERWKAFFPLAEVITYPHAGHFVLEDANEEICIAIKNFLLKEPS